VKPALLLAASLYTVACGGPTPSPEPAPAPVAERTEPPPAPPSVDELLAAIEIPAQPAPEPDAVQATISLDDARTLFAELVTYIEQVQPGAGAGMSWDGVVAMARQQGADLTGLDFSSPVWLVALDRAVAEPPVLIVGRVADEAALRSSLESTGRELIIRDGWAAIGTLAALTQTAPWALTTLITQKPAPGLAVGFRGRTLAGSLWPQLEVILRAQATKLEQADAAPLPEVLGQITSLSGALMTQARGAEVRLGFAGGALELEVTVAPVAGTALAAAATGHEPASFEVAGAFADDPVLLAGRLALDPLPPSLQDFLVGFQDLEPDRERWLSEWKQLSSGEQAIGLYAPDWVGLRWEYAVTDAQRVRRLRATKEPDRLETGAARHRGVPLDRERSPGVELVAWTAGLEGRLTGATGSEGLARVRARIDAMKGKAATPPAWLRAASARASDRGEHAVMLLDLSRLVDWAGATSVHPPGGPRIELGLRLQPQQLALRLRVPPEQYQELVAAAPLFQ
jgi:hypothetical protein